MGYFLPLQDAWMSPPVSPHPPPCPLSPLQTSQVQLYFLSVMSWFSRTPPVVLGAEVNLKHRCIWCGLHPALFMTHTSCLTNPNIDMWICGTPPARPAAPDTGRYKCYRAVNVQLHYQMSICQHEHPIRDRSGSCDAIELVSPDDPALLLSNDHQSLSPWVFYLICSVNFQRYSGIFRFLFFSIIRVTVHSCLLIFPWTSTVVPFCCCFAASCWSTTRAACCACLWLYECDLHPCCTPIAGQDYVHAAPIDDDDVCMCFPGASLTRCQPPRAAVQQRCSVSTWQRDTVKLCSVWTALMTFSSPDPKVSAHNPPLTSLPPSLSVFHQYALHVFLLQF